MPKQVCVECGFAFCSDFYTFLGCASCTTEHFHKHMTWEINNNSFLAPMEQRMAKIGGEHKIKICPCCEERYNVSEHICKKEELAEEWWYVIGKLP